MRIFVKTCPRYWVLCVFVLAAAGCGNPPAVDNFSAFAGYVRDKNYSAAMGMLTDDSKKKFGGNAEKLRDICEGTLKEIFFPAEGKSAAIKDPKWDDEEHKAASGTIYLFDANGQRVGESRGLWRVTNVGGAWQVIWSLATSNKSTVPGNIKE